MSTKNAGSKDVSLLILLVLGLACFITNLRSSIAITTAIERSTSSVEKGNSSGPINEKYNAGSELSKQMETRTRSSNSDGLSKHAEITTISQSDNCENLCDCWRSLLKTRIAKNRIASPISLWRQYSSRILNISTTREEDIALFQNKTDEFKSLIQDLFSFLTSSRLLKSSETFPQDLKVLKSLASGKRCAFVWVANRVSEFRSAAAIEDFLKPYLNSSSGWKAEGNSYRSKHGFVAKEASAKFSLTIPSLETDVRYLMILALKSYGTEWEGARLRMSINGKEFYIDGHHNSTTSVIIPHKFDLSASNSIKKGQSITVDFCMVGGKTFKITGMAFCS